MSLYTLSQLLDDCAARPARTRGAAARRRETLEEVWRALNAWIDSRLREGKGVHVAAFASVSWELAAPPDARLRPALVLSDAFLRAHALTQKPAGRGAPGATLAPLEDVNFTKLAIKFSRRLTKDAAFCGLRDLLQRLGQVAGSGAALSVGFCFGRLVAKHRSVSVLFDPQRLPRALEHRLALASPAELAAAELSPAELAADAPSLAPSDLLDWVNPFPHVFPGDADGEPDGETDAAEPKAEAKAEPKAEPKAEDAATERKAAPGAGVERELRLLDALLSPVPPAGARPSAHARVFESAFRRHIAELAGDVGREAQHARDEHRQQRRDVEAMALEAEARRRRAEDVQQSLRGQMRRREEAAAGERRAWRATDPRVNSFYSESEQERRGFEDRAFRRRVTLELKQQLQAQMGERESARRSARQQALDDDRSFLRRVRAEMEALELKQARDREELRQALTGSWSRDAGLKQLAAARKRQLAAAELAPPPGPERERAARPPAAAAADADDFSVGFDIRSVSGD